MPLSKFFKETGIDGLCYIRKEKPKFLKVFWFTIFLVGLGATGRSFFMTIQYFLSKPTSTQYKILSQRLVELPRIAICTSNRFNGSMLRKLNMSADLVSALNYGYTFYDDAFSPARMSQKEFMTLLERTEQEYQNLMEKLNFTDHAQLLDMLYSKCQDIIKHCKIGIGSSVPCCESANLFEHTFGSCVLLPKYFQSGSVSISRGPELLLKFPSAAELNPANNQWMTDDFVVYLGHGESILDLSMTGNAIARGSYTELSIKKVSFKAVHNPPEYTCKNVKVGEQYSALNCTATCIAKMVLGQQLSCKSFAIPGRKIGSYDHNLPTCNPWSMQKGQVFSQALSTQNLNVTLEYIEQMADQCNEECPELCAQIRYEVSYRKVSKLSQPMLEITWNDFKKAAEMAENYGVLNVGMEKIEETRISQQFSFTSEMLVGQLGGFLGLFLGGSLISLLHVIVFLIQSVLCSNKGEISQK